MTCPHERKETLGEFMVRTSVSYPEGRTRSPMAVDQCMALSHGRKDALGAFTVRTGVSYREGKNRSFTAAGSMMTLSGKESSPRQ